MRPWLLPTSLIVIGGLVAAVAFWPRREGEATRSAEFVGAADCVRCHEREAARWTGSHHDLAMQQPDERTVLGDFADATFTHFGVTSTFFRRDGGWFVRTDGPDGALRDYRIAWVFGFTPLQQYLIAFPDGRLQCLGIAWDSRPAEQGGQRWFHLYPGEAVPHGDLLHWTGPNQNWNFMCADCHSTDLRKNYDPATDRFATSWQDLDVACEACHGPGSAHAAWAHALAGREPTPDDDRRLAVSLRRTGHWQLEPDKDTATLVGGDHRDRQVDTCARCHARSTVLRSGFAYGTTLLDSRRPALLDAGLYHADGQILDEVYEYGSFLQSRMHHAGVVCTDCHEPHGMQLLASGNDLCTRCHRAAKYDVEAHHRHAPRTEGSRCVACHMIQRTYMVVDPRRDHSFRVPRPDLSVRLGTPNACNDCHRDRTPAWAAAEVEKAHGRKERPLHHAEALHAARTGAPDAARQLIRVAVDAAMPAIARATALSLLDGHPGPETTTALRAGASDGDALLRFGAMLGLAGTDEATVVDLAGPRLADPVLLVRTEAARLLAHVPSARLPERLRQPFDAALADYVQAMGQNADRAWAHVNLALLHLARGERAPAEAEYRTALRVDPWSVPAAVNLADLLREDGRDQDGEAVLRALLARVPDAGDAWHALGLLLVRQQRLPDALAPLADAARLRPDQPSFTYAYAVALHEAGQSKVAIAALTAAHGRHPGDLEILIALATWERESGNLPEALRWARKVADLRPDDPAARQLVDELLTELGK